MTLSAFIIKSDQGAVLYNGNNRGPLTIGYELANAKLFRDSPIGEDELNEYLGILKTKYPAHSWTKYKISIY